MEKIYKKNQLIKNHYDTSINLKIKDYEYHRWFSSINNYLLFNDTYKAINRELTNLKYSSVIEVGAGSGIWSKFLFLNSSDLQLYDVDISKEMINLHKKYFPRSNSVEYINEDFTLLDLNKFEKKIDLFYSIRCIEYIENFNKLFENINFALKDSGRGLIITKKAPLLRKTKIHTTNNGMVNLKKSISDNGMEIEKIRPVSYQFPVPYLRNLTFLTRFTNFSLKLIFKDKITWFNYLFLETYLVLFKKNAN